jgi:hypothetical protein
MEEVPPATKVGALEGEQTTMSVEQLRLTVMLASVVAVPEQAHSCKLLASPKCWLWSPNSTSTFSLPAWYILSMVAVTGHATLVSRSLGNVYDPKYLYRRHQLNRLRPLCCFCMDIVVIDLAFRCACLLPCYGRSRQTVHDDAILES